MSDRSEVSGRLLAVKGLIFDLDDEDRAKFDSAYLAIRSARADHPDAFALAISLIVLELSDEEIQAQNRRRDMI